MLEGCLTLNARKPAARILRRDPTRTLMIRNGFIKELRRRFKRLKLHIYEFLVLEDQLGLVENFIRNADQSFAFQSDPDKLNSFVQWLQTQLENDILYAEATFGILSTASITGTYTMTSSGLKQGWTIKFVESAYKRGLINAYLASRRALAPDDPNYIDIAQEEFLRKAFLAPERISKVRLLSSRSFEQLRGLNAQIASKVSTILAQGMIDGKSVTAIAREIFENVDSISESKALAMARTEIIHAHAEGQLDGFEDLGIDSVGVLAEFSTAGDDLVCPKCARLEGKTYTIEQARGKIPIHRNCRCAWIPKIKSLR